MTEIRRLGVHTSIAGGLHLSLSRALDLGTNTMQIFTHNPRTWKTTPISEQEIEIFKRMRRDFDINPVYSHASYLINISSTDEELRRKSVGLLKEEMERASVLGADYVVLHTGVAYDSHGIERAAASLKEVLGEGWASGLLIENTAGRRGDIAPGIRELALIMEGTGGLVAGICIDTCHAFSCGYDIKSEEGIERFYGEIRRYTGLDALRLIHLNDSKGALGSHIDRHEHIGRGMIGREALGRFINYRAFRKIPLILETPKKSDRDDVKNLNMVRGMMKQAFQIENNRF